jgi:hypothetical protein
VETHRTLLDDLAKYFIGPADPRERLDALRRDRLDAEAEIRVVLDRLAAKYNAASEDVDEAMASIGLAVGDMTYEAEVGYLEEMDLQKPA